MRLSEYVWVIFLFIRFIQFHNTLENIFIPKGTWQNKASLYQNAWASSRCFATYELKFSHLHLNFEIKVQEAARQLWPEIIIKACKFCLAHAWWR